jgi:uncharacterized protein (DUF4415 family)
MGRRGGRRESKRTWRRFRICGARICGPELVSARAEDIFNKPITRKQKAQLDRLKKMPDSEIDCSDIPPLSDEQLAQFRRAPKVLVAARLDRDVYD